MPRVVWSDFVSLPYRIGPSKQQHNGVARQTRYAQWQCPHCQEVLEAVADEGVKVEKAKVCQWHLWKTSSLCPNRPVGDERGKPKGIRRSVPLSSLPSQASPAPPPPRPGALSPSLRRRTGQGARREGGAHRQHIPPQPAPPRKRTRPPSDATTTIYALVHVPTKRVVYTGKTVDPDRRMGAHRAPSSGCRLVRQFVRKHGRASIDLQPLVRCAAGDADANEDLYIRRNDTMFPRGLNLRHAAGAGEEADECTALMPVQARPPPPEPPTALAIAHRESLASPEAAALGAAAAWMDLALVLAGVDDDEDAVDETQSTESAHVMGGGSESGSACSARRLTHTGCQTVHATAPQ